ncbi:Zinc-binding GTPase YeiR [Psychrobacter sp. SC65A.3]|uniref:CobW family GTP-binding protein n=1 Tax=Psychrobacter sp. SC65A.3 TaxID=2983299 RepID=UPI0021D99AED|nr:GTP-binding protein [Psychrobacter sp. SC65A.3]WAI88933.1 Zinc-binding GTPase YeiR [Psychrobacter sp. SC65A.3]
MGNPINTTGATLKSSIIHRNIPCTLVTGFLGSGKTTLINQLIADKSTDERWALLINEFGRIGIDAALVSSSQDSNSAQNNIAIREVSGGCICCTSQLPLQIAISRLLSDHHPQRLLIEPTGLAHPRELIRQLSAPHWQTALKMQAVITVLNALQWQREKYRAHEGFQAHIRDANVLVINRYAQLSTDDKQALQDWIAELNAQITIIWAESDDQTTINDISTSNDYSAVLSTQLNKPSQTISQQRTVNIAQPKKSVISLQPLSHSLSNKSLFDPSTNDNDIQADKDIELPYRYHEIQQDIVVAGWRLPADSILNADKLQDWLLTLPNWQRIKGVLHTSNGWLQINFTPDSLSTKTVSVQADSRLEIILQTSTGQEDAIEVKLDWEAYDHELMALIL